MTKIYVTKHPSRGVQEKQGEPAGADGVRVGDVLYQPSEFELTLEEAKAKIKAALEAKVQKLLKQIEKLG